MRYREFRDPKIWFVGITAFPWSDFESATLGLEKVIEKYAICKRFAEAYERCSSRSLRGHRIRFLINVFSILVALSGLLPVCGVASSVADETDADFFEKKIRPVLVTHCYECHSATSKKPSGELLLDSRNGVRQGGETGAAISERHPEDSLLIKAIRYADDSIKMPPKGKLPDATIADFESWIRRGAFDPREQTTLTKSNTPWNEVMRERGNWWSLKPLSKPALPTVADEGWANDPVDRFVFAKLSESGIAPAGATDPRTLVRRLSLVLTGLPPTIEQADNFVAACRSVAGSEPLPKIPVEAFVDSLLDSPHFGEHWARHWMDVVRFSETHGNEWNYEVHHAWRYRDYLIRAFNSDVPYDQFVREHLAGDLLPNPRWNTHEQFNESVIGTGFFRFGEVNHDDCITLRSIGYDLSDNQIDTLTKAFQATTVACARCHNHKLDAVSSEDYYSLLAILRSSRNVSHCIDAPEVNAALKSRLQAIKSELRHELGYQWQTDAAQFKAYMDVANAVRVGRVNAAELSKGLDPLRLEKWVAVLKAENMPFEEPFEIWRRIAAIEKPIVASSPPVAPIAAPTTIPQIWKDLVDQFTKEHAERSEFNKSRFVKFGDILSKGEESHRLWQSGGQSMFDDPSQSGDFVVSLDGDSVVQMILPAGRFTNALSTKLNGTLRSSVIPNGKKYISFHVIGQRSSAVRLVSNHCQLNYANYRAMTFPDFSWVTLSPPDDRDSLQTYAELMTMFDNPKFPDQLSALGGDTENYKLPWDKASEIPRSYFGVTQVILHDSPETPKAELSFLKGLFSDKTTAEPSVETLASKNAVADVRNESAITVSELVDRYVRRMKSAIEAWANDQASDDDVRWLDALVRRELLSNKVSQSNRCDLLVREYRTLDAKLSIPRVAVGVADGGPGIQQPVFLRGDCNRPTDSVPRRYLQVLTPEPFHSPGSGRMELADQIASAENPLTARVMVNRIWHHLFGAGLVRTVDDFGHVGEQPSHPELLDYLANRFIEDGWSVKRLIRSLVLSNAFQQSNRASTLSREIDPQNRLIQHYSARRMDAESVRDSILAASGRLDRILYGQSIQPYREKEYADRRLFPGPLDGNGRRSVYIKNNLMEAPKFLSAFNFPGGKVTQGRRDVTNVPAQALALLNDPFVLQQAEFWSQKILARSTDSIATRLDEMFRSALSRSPTAEEESRFEETIQQLADLYEVPSDGIMSSSDIWKDISHALFNLNELIYIP